MSCPAGESGGTLAGQVDEVRIPGLTAVDVADARLDRRCRDDLLARLIAVHLRYFADHPHVPAEWRQGLRVGWPDPEVVVHLWLLRFGGQDVGEAIIHTNLRRGVVMFHFLAVDRETRYALPYHWLDELSDAVVECGRRDARSAGVPLRAMACEIPSEHLHKWARTGFRPMRTRYQEPRHGMHWREHGPSPEFFDMLGIIRVLDAHDEGIGGAGTSAPERPTPDGAAVRAFLLDHYRLDPTHPNVARMLAEADGVQEV